MAAAHRARARSPPQGHWRTTTFVAGPRQTGIVAPLVLDGLMSGAAFRAYIAQFLAPTLAPDDVVGQSRRPQGRRRQARARRGRCLDPLPAALQSGPGPIEQPFAKLKALLRKAAARTRDQLWHAIGRLLATVPAGECANCLSRCRYGST